MLATEFENNMDTIFTQAGYTRAPISHDKLMRLMSTNMVWAKLFKEVKEGMTRKGLAFKPSLYTAEHLLDLAGLDYVMSVPITQEDGTTKHVCVGVDMTLDPALGQEKESKLLDRKAAYTLLGITTTVVLMGTGVTYGTSSRVTPALVSSFKKRVVPQLMDAIKHTSPSRYSSVVRWDLTWY
jgi:hypothetical protein